jgi:SOS response associated peptidase (SRAP)
MVEKEEAHGFLFLGALVVRGKFVRHDCDMCGRFTRLYRWRELVALYRLTDPSPPSNLQPRYNICPTTTIDAVIERDSKRVFEQMRWGLVPGWWKKPLKELRLATFNARAETVAEKPFYRSAFKHTLPDPGIRLLRMAYDRKGKTAVLLHATGRPDHNTCRSVVRMDESRNRQAAKLMHNDNYRTQ